jgi:hypothetical protein
MEISDVFPNVQFYKEGELVGKKTYFGNNPGDEEEEEEVSCRLIYY